MKTIMVLVIALILTACSTTQTYWLKEGVTNQEFEREKYECTHNAQVASNYWNPNQNIFAAAMALKMNFEYCMRAKGYRPIQIPKNQR